GGDACKSEVGLADITQDVALDRIEPRRRQAVAMDEVRGITVRTEAKAHQVEQVLSDRLIGGGIEPGAETVCGLDLMGKKTGKLPVDLERPHHAVVHAPAEVGEPPVLNTDAPTMARRHLRYPGWLVSTHQRHLPFVELDGPAALGRLHASTG